MTSVGEKTRVTEEERDRDANARGGRQLQRMSATQSGVTPMSASSMAARVEA